MKSSKVTVLEFKLNGRLLVALLLATALSLALRATILISVSKNGSDKR
jgi:hypothetical protein